MDVCSGLRCSEELAHFDISDLLCVTSEVVINNESTGFFFILFFIVCVGSHSYLFFIGASEAYGRGIWLEPCCYVTLADVGWFM